MKYIIHDGYTADPNATLPSGSDEVSISSVLKHLPNIGSAAEQIEFKIKRKLRLAEGNDHYNYNDLLMLLSKLIESRRQTDTVVAVMAPWYDDSTLSKSEGYIRRIEEIDKTVLNDFFCIYFYECPYFSVQRLIVDKISENRIYIRYNTAYKNQREAVEKIISHCNVCYSHSVLRLIPVVNPEDGNRWLNIFSGNTKHIIDLHGAVVEEAIVNGDTESVPLCEKSEKLYLENSDACIVLTDAMTEYLHNKYSCESVKFFRTPVLSKDITLNDPLPGKPEKITAVYSGGCQPWQNIPLIQSAISSVKSDIEFRIFVSSPEKFKELWGDRTYPDNLYVKNGNSDEIKEAYMRARYGFIVRDDNNLNRVACPTKIMEYIQFGIIPIVKSRNIGDFIRDGLYSVSVDDFTDGRLEPYTVERKHAAENKMITDRYKDDYVNAVSDIKLFIKS